MLISSIYHGLIIEGIPGSGKSSVLNGILKSQKFLDYSFESCIILNEFHTQRVLEQKDKENSLCKQDHLDILDFHLSYIEKLKLNIIANSWCDPEAKGLKFASIFERFHLSHLFYYNNLSWNDVSPVDSALVNLGVKLCVLLIDKDTILNRLIKCRKEDSGWMNFIKRYGSSNKEIVDSFMYQQEKLINEVRNSKLEAVFINTNNISIEETVKTVNNFWL